MVNLLPLRLIFIRTYERDSDKERLREDIYIYVSNLGVRINLNGFIK